jgi:hypothetical protein
VFHADLVAVQITLPQEFFAPGLHARQPVLADSAAHVD